MSARQTSKPSLPETPLAVAFITDATAPMLLGMSSRAFREAVVRDRVPFVRLGKRIIVSVEDLRALARGNVTEADQTTKLDDGPTSADSMLADLGFARGVA